MGIIEQNCVPELLKRRYIDFSSAMQEYNNCYGIRDSYYNKYNIMGRQQYVPRVNKQEYIALLKTFINENEKLSDGSPCLCTKVSGIDMTTESFRHFCAYYKNHLMVFNKRKDIRVCTIFDINRNINSDWNMYFNYYYCPYCGKAFVSQNFEKELVYPRYNIEYMQQIHYEMRTGKKYYNALNKGTNFDRIMMLENEYNYALEEEYRVLEMQSQQGQGYPTPDYPPQGYPQQGQGYPPPPQQFY